MSRVSFTMLGPVIGILVAVSHFSCLKAVSAHSHSEKTQPLLLISFDGFRWDYLTRAQLPNIEKIIRSGVHATEGVKAVFDTSTLPNHWSLVTGLYPESHGVISNHLRDIDIERQFIPKYIDASYHNDPRYYDNGGEPIWVTNQIQGGRSGSIMWWGSENPVKWSWPTLQMPYDDSVNFTARVDVIIDWLSQEQPVNLGLVYFSEPDSIGHKAGPESSNVTEAIKYTDVVVGYLLDRLEEKDLLNQTNIIITSDHGMATTSNKTLVFLNDFVNIEDYDILNDDTVIAQIFPHHGKLDMVYESLEKASKQPNSHFKVYRTEDIPERYHMKNSDRVAPIVAIADMHYRLVANGKRGDDFPLAGAHGYDNEERDMWPFFIAMGPGFKRNFTVRSFETVDVYPLMCELLGIRPAPNNGSLAVVSQLLNHEAEETLVTTLVIYAVMLVVVSGMAGVFAVAAFRQSRKLKKRTLHLQLSPKYERKKMKYASPADRAARTRMLAEDELDLSDMSGGEDHKQA